MVDKFDRKINYARISLTSDCNLKCVYCNNDYNKKTDIPTEFYENIIDVLSDLGIEKIRFTGGEPLLNKNITQLVKYASEKENIKEVCITTNGVLFHEYANELVKNGLTRINFSLDSLEEKEYFDITGKDKLKIVLNNINIAKEKGLEVKVNIVLLEGITLKNLKSFFEFGYENNVQIRFIELMPIGDNLEYYHKNYLSSSQITSLEGVRKIENNKNEVSDYFMYKDKYIFGIISPISNHFCNKCNRIRITSSGRLRLCLHSDVEIDLLKYANNKEELFRILENNILSKPEKHLINEKKFASSSMVKIGG